MAVMIEDYRGGTDRVRPVRVAARPDWGGLV